MKKKVVTLGVSAAAAGALALGGVATSADAGSTCAYNNQFHITKRHNVSCKSAKKVLKDYLNNGCPSSTPASAHSCTVQHHTKWKCPSPYNDQLGKCKRDKDTSFRYKGNY